MDSESEGVVLKIVALWIFQQWIFRKTIGRIISLGLNCFNFANDKFAKSEFRE